MKISAVVRFVSTLVVALVVVASPKPRVDIDRISSTEATGHITSDFISIAGNLDGPKLSAINNTAWDWWYFDAVAPDLKSSVAIVFYTASVYGFPFLKYPSTITVLQFSASLPNGTIINKWINATEAVVTTVKDGSSGIFGGTGAAWIGAPDLSRYLVTINSPANGIHGTFKLKSEAPAHYPCSPVKPGQNMMVGPNIGWSNAVPDAVATVNFKIDGSKLGFTGVGYHDKNWSPQSFTDNVDSWLWGHGRLGDYSIVWFDFLGIDGKNYISAYAAKAGKIITASCDLGSIKVRPSGVNSEYPPHITSGNPGGFTVDMDLGGGSLLWVNVTAVSIVLEGPPVYTRWIGSMAGSIDGGAPLTGIALFEEFKMTPP